MGLKIWPFNAGKRRVACQLILERVCRESVDVIIIQGPYHWMRGNDMYVVDVCGKLAIGWSKRVMGNFVIRVDLCAENCMGLLWEHDGTQMILFNIYVRPRKGAER